MIRRPPRSTLDRSSAASDVYKRQSCNRGVEGGIERVRDGDCSAALGRVDGLEMVASHTGVTEEQAVVGRMREAQAARSQQRPDEVALRDAEGREVARRNLGRGEAGVSVAKFSLELPVDRQRDRPGGPARGPR